MSKTIFVTGGARSGKSAFAEKLALEFSAPLCYLATAQALDAENGRPDHQTPAATWRCLAYD